jgi:NitT/TauT family transport system substrate-binding protein
VSGGLNSTSLPVYFANDGGPFSKRGLTVTVSDVSADTTALQGLVGTDYDAAFTSAGTGITALGSNAKIKLVSSVSPHLEYFFLAQKDIADLKGMQGKALGVSTPGSVSYLAPRVLLQQAGVDVDGLNVVSAGNDAARVQALTAKTIDGAVVNTVNTVAALKANPDLHVIADVGAQLANTFLNTAIIVRQDLIQNSADSVQSLVEGLIDASRTLQSDRTTAINYAMSTNQLPNESVAQAYDMLTKSDTPFFGVDGGLQQAPFDATVQLLVQGGTIQAPVTWEQAADPSFISKAVDKVGPYKKQ